MPKSLEYNIDFLTLTEKEIFKMKLRGDTIFLGPVHHPRMVGYYIDQLVKMGVIRKAGPCFIPSVGIEVQYLQQNKTSPYYSGMTPTNIVLNADEEFVLPEAWFAGTR